jgi:predicted transposase YbfD/YdcC
MDASVAAPVLRLVSGVKDPRRHNRVHPLPSMIVMAVVAVLCGSDGWEDVAEFCEEAEPWLDEVFALPRGVPSADTFARVFARVDPEELDAVIRSWMTALGFHSGGKQIHIDGKSARRSFERAWNKSAMAHLVGAYASEHQVVLGQVCVPDKQNEIVAIPKLLALLDVRGSTVTLDAIGCQREIARQICDGGGEHVLQVKDNQPTLHEKVKTLLDEAKLEKMKGWQGSSVEQTHGGHGRIETRRAWLTTEVEHLGQDLLELWPTVKAVAAVERERQVIGQEKSLERHYYLLSDGQCTAEQVAKVIRNHWSIENGLHHVLDVSFNEDQSRVRKGYGQENLSRLRRLTASLLRQNPDKRSIKLRRKCCGWSLDYALKTLLRGLPPA